MSSLQPLPKRYYHEAFGLTSISGFILRGFVDKSGLNDNHGIQTFKVSTFGKLSETGQSTIQTGKGSKIEMNRYQMVGELFNYLPSDVMN